MCAAFVDVGAAYGCSSPGVRGATDASGAVIVTNPPPAPAVAAPLPAPVAGEPAFPRVDGHLPTGFNDGALDSGQTDPGVVGAITAAAGGTMARVSLAWSTLQPEAPPCELHWGFADGRYHRLLSAGVRPLWVVRATPPWAGRCELGAPSSCRPPPDAAHIGAYAGIVRAIARRYPLSAGVEVWNEPNLERFWHDPSTDPSHRAAYYDRLLEATWAQVHPAHPSFRVLGGVVSEAGDDSATFGTAPATFLRRMKQDGALDDLTALSIHPYPERPPDAPGGDHFVRTFAQLGEILGAGSPVRLAVSELGVPVPGPFGDWTLQTQCTTLMGEYGRMDAGDATLPLAANVDMVLFHVQIEGGDNRGFGLGWIQANTHRTLLPWRTWVDSYTYTPGPAFAELRRTIGAREGAAPDPAACGSARSAPLPPFPPDP